MSDDRLLKILEKGDEKAGIAFFKGMSETERRRHFPLAKKFMREVNKNRFVEAKPGTVSMNLLAPAAEAAFFATATFAEIKKQGRMSRPGHDVAYQLLVDRRPDWVDELVELLLNESYYWNAWPLIRRLMAAGLARKPDSPNYYLGMLGGISHRFGKAPLEKLFCESPDLLDHDVWKLFEFEGSGENSLANHQRFSGDWNAAFLSLMQMGKLPRDRLIECSIEALERDFNHYRARWFHEFYDSLEPTEKELRNHADRFLGLLRASAPNVATWAFAKVETLAQSGFYAVDELCKSIEPLLSARAKGTALQVLKVLAGQAEQFPNRAVAIARIAANGLTHEKSDVQNAAFAVVEKYASPPDSRLRQTVEQYLDSLAASVKNRVAKWLANETVTENKPDKKSSSAKQKGKTKKPVANFSPISPPFQKLFSIDGLQSNLERGVFEIPAAIFDGTDIPRLSNLERITPVAGLEELVEVCARVVEDGSNVDDVERCIDGLSRMCDEDPTEIDRLFGPLLKRIRRLIKKENFPFCGCHPASDVMGLVYVFCTGEDIDLRPETIKHRGGVGRPTSKTLCFDFEGTKIVCWSNGHDQPLGFLSRRCKAVSTAIRLRSSRRRLSIPTHVGGWIDPRVLVARVNAWPGELPDDHDLILALLRLAPEFRPEALSALESTEADWVEAIQYALGVENIAIGNEVAVWVAAARSRQPWVDDSRVARKFPGLGPDAGEAAMYELRIASRVSAGHTSFTTKLLTTPKPPSKNDQRLVTSTMHGVRTRARSYHYALGGFAGESVASVRWVSTIWPIARDSFLAGGMEDCFANLDWWEARWWNRSLLEPLLDSGTPLRHVGLHFLAGMLAAKEPGESGLATDIAIRAIEDGRLGSDNLGAALATLLQSGINKPGRWQKTLDEIARASLVHAAVIQIALQECLTGSTEKLPRDCGKLLDLLYELSVEHELPVVNPACRTFLEKIGSLGKTGKLAAKLLALKEDDAAIQSKKAILKSAIEQRKLAASQLQSPT